MFIPLKAIEGVGFAFIWPSLQAYFGESRKELRVYNIMWRSGVTFSPFIGGFIVQLFGLKYVFIPPMLLLALSFAFGLALSSDNKKEHKSPSKKALNENGRKEIRIFLFPFIYGFILLTISTFFPIYAGSNGIAAIQTGYLLALWNFGRILSFILPDRVHRIFGRSVELLILTIASGFLSSLIAFQNQIVFLILELFSLGLIPGLVFSSMQYKILQIDKERRGFYAGILESIIMIGAFLATFIGGFVASGNLTGVFFLPIIFSLFVLILYLLMHRIN